uniref:Uncharacterized protein n=1 Tax=Zea mays TaxID=4577 RepID=A0A804MMS6_MAIZE
RGGITQTKILRLFRSSRGLASFRVADRARNNLSHQKPESLHGARADERGGGLGVEQLQRGAARLDAPWRLVLVDGAALADQQVHERVEGAGFHQPYLQW